MVHKPKILYNPTDKKVEFMCDHLSYIFESGEKRNLDGFVAYHALEEVNTGLKEYIPGKGEKVSLSSVDYNRIPWRKVVSMASERGIFHPGDNKLQVIKALIKADDKEAGTIQEPSTEKA